jgi:hypothetical protein
VAGGDQPPAHDNSGDQKVGYCDLSHLGYLDCGLAADGQGSIRLLQWILAGVGLSAAWHLNDGERPDTSLAVAEMAFANLHG